VQPGQAYAKLPTNDWLLFFFGLGCTAPGLIGTRTAAGGGGEAACTAVAAAGGAGVICECYLAPAGGRGRPAELLCSLTAQLSSVGLVSIVSLRAWLFSA
jgi:hypothetical protein